MHVVISSLDTVLDETLDTDPVTISEFTSAAILYVAAACPYHCLHVNMYKC